MTNKPPQQRRGSAKLRVELNGEKVKLDQGATVASLIDDAHRGVAVAVDGEVVPKSKWGLTPLSDGQRVEVVGATQGG